MALQNIFKFRELPESQTSKPFLEHLEDLRWTIVKVAITLVAAMIICFTFRSTLVRVMQAPLHEIDPQVGALRALGITDSLVISFHLAFYAGIVLSFPLLLYFSAEFVLPALTAVEKRFLLPAILSASRCFCLACWSAISGCCRRRFFFSSATPSRLAGRLLGRCNSIILL